jgi:hypothetical protein
MSGDWPFHEKNRLILFWGLTISWQNRVCVVMKCSSPRHSISLFCHEIFKSQTYYQSVLAWNGQAPDIWYYVWGSTISWQHRLILCLRLDHFMTKPTDTISEASPFHDKTDSVLSWNGQAPEKVSVCVVMKCSSPRHSICLFCNEMVKTRIEYQSVLSDKTDWYRYYVWGLTISWQNRLMLCLELDHFMT